MELDNVVRKYKDNSISAVNLSRYKNSWRIVDSSGDFYQESADEIEITQKPTDRLHVVQPGEENRLDLIAFNYYNSPLYWWVIAEASGLSNPLDLPIGTTLRIPDKQSLFGSQGVMAL